jgi:hypothetical protein
MRFNWLIYWRTSFVFWLALFLYFAVTEVFNHSYRHPMEVLLIPGVFVVLSVFQIRRIKNR